jgi:hypothetical protein
VSVSFAIMGRDVLGTGIKADQPSPYTSYADEPLAPLTSASLAFSVHAMFTTALSESASHCWRG